MRPEILSFLSLLIQHFLIVLYDPAPHEDLFHEGLVDELFVHAYHVLQNLLYARERPMVKGLGG